MSGGQGARSENLDQALAMVPTDALVAELARRRAMIERVLQGGTDPEVVGVVRAVADAWGLHPTRLFRRGRSQPAAEARQAAMVLLRERGMAFSAIGAAFHLDHGTAMHAVRTQPARLADEGYARKFAAALVSAGGASAGAEQIEKHGGPGEIPR